MEYQKVINLLDNETSKFITKTCGKTNYQSQGTYDAKNIWFKITKLKSTLCAYSGTYMLKKGTIAVVGQKADDAAIEAGRNDK